MKKIVLFALLTFSMFATARPTNQQYNPIPTCNPCDMVR
jgi:hypothetical protein